MEDYSNFQIDYSSEDFNDLRDNKRQRLLDDSHNDSLTVLTISEQLNQENGQIDGSGQRIINTTTYNISHKEKFNIESRSIHSLNPIVEESKESSRLIEEGFFKKYFSFYNAKNTEIAKTIVILSLSLILTFIVMSFSYEPNQWIFLISCFGFVFVITSPKYLGIAFNITEVNILALLIYTFFQTILLCYANLLVENNHVYNSLGLIIIAMGVFIFKLKYNSFFVRDYLSALIYTTIILGAFGSLYLSNFVSLFNILVICICIIYLCVDCHVIYCLNYQFERNFRIDNEIKDKDSTKEVNLGFFESVVNKIKKLSIYQNNDEYAKRVFRIWTDMLVVGKFVIYILLNRQHH